MLDMTQVGDVRLPSTRLTIVHISLHVVLNISATPYGAELPLTHENRVRRGTEVQAQR